MAYKALVILNMDGGNDSFNMVVPTGAGYSAYATARGTALTIPEGSLQATPYGVGLHPNLGALASRASRLAILANSGTLVQPTTKAQYLAASVPIPPQLFSHNDQARQWQSPSPLSALNAAGWGTGIAAAVSGANTIPLLTSISLSGETKVLSGGYAITQNGSVDIYGNFGGDGARRKVTLNALIDLPPGGPFDDPVSDTMREAIDLAGQVNAAIAAAPAFTFPGSLLGQQMRTIARVIASRVTLGADKQIFFVRQGNFDTHEDAGRVRHDGLMATMGAAVAAFDDAMQSIGADVTVLIYSEFGRTLRGNSNGSDHGWGGHQMVLGTSVIGGLYGTLPDLTLEGPSDVGLGRMLPTMSHSQIGSTLALWMGASSSIFPEIANFSTANLGFLP